MFMVNHLTGFGDCGNASGGNDQYTKILLHMEGTDGGTTFTDSNVGGSAHTWTPSSATTSATQHKFGTTSLSTGAAAGKITTPDHADFTFGSSDFTVDMWCYRSGGDATSRYLCGQIDAAGANTTHSVEMFLSSSNVFVLRVYHTTNTLLDVTGTTAFTTTGWHHVAGVRTGNTLKLFVDGVQEGGDVAFSQAVTDSTNNFAVGGIGEFATALWDGYIDEFRLSMGVARWTANFTPPVEAYS